MKEKKQAKNVDRRAFLNTLGVSAGIAASLPAISILSGAANVYADDIGPQGGLARAESSEGIRQDVAERESNVRIPNHDDNGDEALYPVQNWKLLEELEARSDSPAKSIRRRIRP